jgi:hypothetical protein
VKSFTELHAGTFEIGSALGTGTTVTIKFPPPVAGSRADAGESSPAPRAAIA